MRRDDVLGEELQLGVVVLNGLVVDAARLQDPVFGAFQLELQALEVLIGLEIGVVLHDNEQAAEGAVDAIVGGDLVFRACWR